MATMEAKATTSGVLGGWSPYGPVTPEDLKIFNEATEGFVGVKYTPEAVSKQVVNGTNYRFRCLAQPVVLDPIEYHAVVQIYAPTKGKPFVTHITPY